jgi:hypothetical protein
VFHEDSIPDQESPEGVADLQQASTEPAEASQPPLAQGSGHQDVEPAPKGRKGKCRATTRSGRRCTSAVVADTGYCIMHAQDPATVALLQQARRLGGAAPRARLGLGTDAVALGSAEDQLALLVATARALASNSISASTAGAITNIVKAAAQIVQADQGEQIRDLEARVAQIVQEVPRGRR